MLSDHLLPCEKSLPLEDSVMAVLSAFDVLPCALAFWDTQDSGCILNLEARRLTGFSAEDVQHTPSLWVSRIHPQDRPGFFAARERLQSGEKRVACDYRFSPKGGGGEVWLREVARLYRNQHDIVEGILSTYIDVSDLKKADESKTDEEDLTVGTAGIIEEFVHGAQNNLQGISIGADLLRMTCGDSPECETISRGVERSSRLLRELREYFSPPETYLSTKSLKAVVEEISQRMDKEWQSQGQHLRVVYDDPIPPLQLDWKQFRNALERVLAFSFAVLPQEGNGEVEVTVRLRQLPPHHYIELDVVSSSATSVKETEVFRPFLRVNGYQVGLSLVLVSRMLRRHEGEMSFRKDAHQRGRFVILLKAQVGE